MKEFAAILKWIELFQIKKEKLSLKEVSLDKKANVSSQTYIHCKNISVSGGVSL